MASEWHVPDGPALVCAHCGSKDGLRLHGAAVTDPEIPAGAHCLNCGVHFAVALIDEGGDPFNAALGAHLPLAALLRAKHESAPLPHVIDEADDRDGRHWRVSVRAEWVRVEADMASLDPEGQERFAQAYVAACRQAMVNAGTAKGAVTDGA